MISFWPKSEKSPPLKCQDEERYSRHYNTLLSCCFDPRRTVPWRIATWRSSACSTMKIFQLSISSVSKGKHGSLGVMTKI